VCRNQRDGQECNRDSGGCVSCRRREANDSDNEVEAHLGGTGILVNNAGIAHPRKLHEITESEWDEVLMVNLKSVFLVTQAVIGGMRQRRWGRIINLSSVAAQTGGAVGAHYAASKAGIIGLTHSCASAFVKDGVTVNAIAPALIETDIW
jgi:3-oxoacyl-[acyl-carrier protein] reductase